MLDDSTSKLEDATFRALLEAAPDGILLVAGGGKIVFANKACAAIFGYEPGELFGQPIEIVVPDYIRDKHAALRDDYMANPHARPMGVGLDLVAARKDGTTIPVEISLSSLHFEGRDGAVAVVRDVTEQRKLARALRRSNEELEQFAYVASHDLQEPLRMVSGYTSLLKRRYGDKLDKDAGEYIDFAVDGVKRMQALITDLLSFSRLNSRSKPFTNIDLGDVLQQAIANLRAVIEESNAHIEFSALPHVVGDRTQLTQVMQNLLSNAMKFRRADAAPVVRVTATREGPCWRFTIEDNGIGIEPAYHEKVFVIFQRLNAREKYAGTGIGLSICKKIIERHGGRIWIESRGIASDGWGTAFNFTVPAKELST